ncbi:chorismate--pyruvate lyase family protein [Litoribrevibacter euphylliae]|uniref:Probable chorismate pyruvate-lyase n=1 Tax=Litoribrevibacter euphylliae TaxID=1834034 RepID=A0ABV7HFI6_9GAMM
MPETPHYIHRWTSAYKKYANLWSNSQRSWLLHRGSLTKRLMAQSTSSFEVKVNKEGINKLFQHEKSVLACSSDFGWIREVDLIVDGAVWVRARSVVPLSTLTGPDIKLRHLGSKPLGHLLFSSPRYRRKQFEIGRYQKNREIHWGRRSIFTCNGSHKTLLVTETFMPVVFSRQSS